MKGVFNFLTPENIADKYFGAKDYTDNLTEPFPEFERIARNRPHENTPAEYPKTTDGTSASIVRKTGKRVVQQLPTGKVEDRGETTWLSIIAEYVYTNEILPYANEEYDLIQKCWSIIERGLTFGSAAVYTPFINHSGHFSPDMTLPYWGDVFVQPGKKSGYACDYIFLRSWWQPEDIESLIEKEKKLKKSAKERGEEYEATWDLEALESIKDDITRKDEEATTPSEDELGVNPQGIEIVTGFQRGVGACFYTFHPSSGANGKNDAKILRKKYNKDPRGKMPIDWFYADIDGSNPLGRGIIDLLRGLQNLIDADMQMYQYNRALMLAPPLIKRGSFSKRKIVYRPNAIIDLGDDPNASLDTLNVDTSAVTNYPDLYGLQKSQLLNLVSSPDTSISSEVGNPGFGKTPEALKTQQATLSVDDNFLRKMFEALYENWSETAINLFFAERSGIEELQLDKKTADSLRKLAEEGKFDLSRLSDDNKILIDYDTDTPELKFRVDASTSKMKDDAEQGEILMNLIQGVDSSPLLSQMIPSDKILALYNRLVSNSGVENPEELTVDIEEFMAQQEQMAAQQQAMAGEEAALAAQPQEGEVLPPEAQMPQEALQVPEQPVENPLTQITPEQGQLIDDLRTLGVPDDLIAEAVDLMERGAPEEQVITLLDEVMSDARG